MDEVSASTTQRTTATMHERLWSAIASVQDDSRVLVAAVVVILSSVALFLHRRFFHVPADERAVSFKWAAPPEASPTWKGPSLKRPHIDPSKSDAPPASSATHGAHEHIVSYDPSTAQYIGSYPATLPSEIDGMIRRAEASQKAWAKAGWTMRRRVLRSLLQWVVDDSEAICRVACRDTGKTMIDAAFGEILVTAEKLRWCISAGERILSPETRPTNILLAHKISKVHFEPLGVVVAIVSWNYPMHNFLSPVIAALTAGNAIIVKVSENAAFSSLAYLSAIHSCLLACGFSNAENLVQVALCLPDGASYLCGAQGVKHITFIGSQEIGKKVAVRAAESGIPVTMELGGKDPAILLPDADLDFFVDTYMRASFQAAGQNCIGIERFVVASNLYDDFVSRMQPRVAALKQGSVLASPEDAHIDVGAMVSDRQFSNLQRLIDDAVKHGAKVLVGGKPWTNPEYPEGHYWQPTLIVGVTPAMELASQEIFAPVMTVMRYEAVEEAIEIANGTSYGLAAAVFGKNKARCRHVASRLECGMVAINDWAVFYLNQFMPFGGAKGSGYGRIAGPEGLRSLCNVKSITEDRFASVRTSIPPLLAYPVVNGRRSWQFVEGLAQMAFALNISGRAKGVWKLATADRS